MNEKKKFASGVLVGIVLVICLNIIINSFSIIYNQLITHKLTPERKTKQIMSLIDKYYVNPVTKDEINEGIYSGLVFSLNDKYSYYMDKDSFRNFVDSTNGAYVGIGTVVSVDSKDNKIVVITSYKNSSAYEAGITAGDKILKINDIEVSGDNYKEAVQIMKGDKDAKGTEVKLTIYRPSNNKTFDISVKRYEVNVPTVGHKMLENSTGYIIITKFEAVTYDQFVEAYNDLEKNGMQRLIIDLRDNPGGLLNTVVKITDMLVPKGTITYIEDKNGNREYEYSDDEYMNKPLVVLVNEGSASASEVLTGAVKDMNAGKIVGTKTYGKGVVQNTYKLSDGSGVKLTIAKYYTPNGICIDGIGITPDYVIEAPKEDENTEYKMENDIQLQKAIEIVNSL